MQISTNKIVLFIFFLNDVAYIQMKVSVSNSGFTKKLKYKLVHLYDNIFC